MKLTTSLILILFAVMVSNAQKYKHVQNLEKSKVIIGLSGDEEQDKLFKDIINELWHICPISGASTRVEAFRKAKKNENLYVITIEPFASKSSSIAAEKKGFRRVSEGFAIQLSNGKRILAWNIINKYNKKFTPEMITHGTNILQQILREMIDNRMGPRKAFKVLHEKIDRSKLKDKTLYLPKERLVNELTEAKIPELYSGKFEIASYQKWSSAILEKKPDVAYVILIASPLMGGVCL